ncbi:MAG TPA: MG2 domain-containing protein [Gemmataceae bacterium]|nr:MG2 domain-containing protein [Gemmataceae bacterium]
MPNQYQWVVTARAEKDRFAYYGFSNIWFNRQYDPEYNQVKVFAITDRPVYRPAQTVQFKFWVEHAKYDQPDSAEFAKQMFTVRINNPKGERILEKDIATDEYGGLVGEYAIAKNAMLGSYYLYLTNRANSVQGGGHFRIEEYKKPEFEVTVEAPKEPVQLGEKVEATIKAKYYFGAPVVNAKVKYKVLRSSYDSRWFPRGAWDRFYGSGYWWFASDYTWYPGWNEWGCMRPLFFWWRGASEPPEVVMENEVPVGPDGTVKVPIDTSLAKELHGNQDHKFSITAEVVDESRRTIVGAGDVLVSRNPFRVYTWVDRGHYRVGDTTHANFRAQTLDQKPVEGKGELTLHQITYNDKNEPVEHPIQKWKIDTNVEGQAHQEIKAHKPGQFRLSYKLTDSKQHTMEGGYVFVIRGEGVEGKDFRFNDIELITDKREYAPGEKVKLMVNTNKLNSTVLLFLRPTNGVYLPPKVIRVNGKSIEEELAVVQKDMPNCFVEALTVADGKVHTEVREIIVPPEKRVLNVEVLPSQREYRPGQKAAVKIKLTDFNGKPFTGSTVLTMYDKSVEYISGGSNVPEIREFFWKWRRHHYPQTESSLNRWFYNTLRSGEIGMSNLGVFGEGVVEELAGEKGNGMAMNNLRGLRDGADNSMMFARGAGMPMAPMAAAPAGPGGGGGGPMAPGPAREEGNMLGSDDRAADKAKAEGVPGGVQPAGQPPGPAIRKNFADTAFWSGSLTTDKDGIADVTLNMPENLTGWKIKCWAMGLGTKVGEGETIVTTKKDLLVRMQAPRFFVQKDEVVLSANVHNYLKADKDVMVTLELDGGVLAPMGNLQQQVKIAAGGEQRVDWRVRVQSEGEAIVRMKAVADAESDAMEMRFPAFVHGMLKTDSFSGVVRPDKDSAQITFTVPEERRINESRLEVRYSPTLAGAMVDALPYMVDYPYGCTEQTLNRFLPTVITQRILQRMGLNLKDIEQKRTNLNAQEIGNDKERAKGWKRFPRNPVFNDDEVRDMTIANIQALQNMQLSDGGWGWFSGFGEHSWPHTTAVVVHGLQIAKSNDVVVPPAMLDRGIGWLKTYQATQTQMIRNAPTKTKPWKEHADNLDAFVYMVLVDADVKNDEMRDYLYRDRNHLAVYGKAMLGLALHKQQRAEELAMILKNIEQYVVQDEENQTAYLRLPPDNAWWYWYGSEIESDAYYLKLLARANPKGETASRLVKYLLNNRKHATYWNSTRDTAICIEAMSEYLVASGEDKPDMTVEIWLDGKKYKDARIAAENLFTFDNQFVLFGDAIESGKHVLEVRRQGKGPVYFNAYETNFTLEDFITKAGLEVKVNRKFYKLTPVDKKIKIQGSSGQALDQKVEKYERAELPNLATLKSGDLVEIELEIDSKNDYEYIVFEDPKAAGFEPVLVRSGYNANDMGAYMELRDDRVCFFVRALARGKHSVSYRMRAEIPGKFSALPTRASAMYAPELRGNSDEIKLGIVD